MPDELRFAVFSIAAAAPCRQAPAGAAYAVDEGAKWVVKVWGYG